MRQTPAMNYPRLETERLYLRELTLDDAPAVQLHFSDPKVTELMDLDPCTDLEAAREIIAYHLEDTGVRWGAFDRETDALVGTCGYHCWEEASAQAEIGYDLTHEYWGRGLMREAVDAALTFGFGRMGLSVVYAISESANARSIKMLEGLGFKYRPEIPDPEGLGGLYYTLPRPVMNS
jgi:ribosomal-protein-alanine N-acetyltransferase